MQPIRVLLADDHPLFRSGLKNVLQADPAFNIVGEASRGDEALLLARGCKPDLVIMDVSMPVMDGIECTRQLKEHDPSIKVLMLSTYSDDAYWQESMEAGASGYVLKRAVDTELIIAIRAVMEGERYIYPTLLGGFCKPGGKAAADEVQEEVLSPREQEVLLLIALGHTQQEIAEQLTVSIKTVDSYKTRIREKLNLTKRSDMVRYALKHNIISDKTV
ncbi:response regulator transcription factor [Paenibacillus sp. YN15]|uniref:response regulator transcription factor n=1 Tax=Paenibacillus sp. YN15 TaxID=1742774 RepID=UPI000DCD8E7F|nr:response regulator transcription factor [Paenibacillus sp. YN15]RAV01781.1 DNA-binding response regulator [Paenibacillus sp. YN15]